MDKGRKFTNKNQGRQVVKDSNLLDPKSKRGVPGKENTSMNMSKGKSRMKPGSSRDVKRSLEVSSDSSLERKTPSKATQGSDKRMGRLNLNAKNNPKRRLTSKGKESINDRKSTRMSNLDTKRSPEFGGNDSDDQRLETFGEESRRNEGRREGARRTNESGLNISKSTSGHRRHTSKDTKENLRGKHRLDDNRSRQSQNRDLSNRPGTTKNNKARGSQSLFKDKGRGGAPPRPSRGGQRGLPSRDSRHSAARSSYDNPQFNKYINSKTSHRAPKSLNFSEAKNKRQKDWFLDFKAHRPIVNIPYRFEQPIKSTTSYLIKIESLNKIPTEQIPQLKERGVVPTLTYSCTLYDEKEKEFIGRTYTSQPMKLTPSFKDTDPKSREFLFMHVDKKTGDNL